jgi:hypothetical protein
MGEPRPPQTADGQEKGPTTPAEESSRQAPDHVVTPGEKAKVAEEASRQEDA